MIVKNPECILPLQPSICTRDKFCAVAKFSGKYFETKRAPLSSKDAEAEITAKKSGSPRDIISALRVQAGWELHTPWGEK